MCFSCSLPVDDIGDSGGAKAVASLDRLSGGRFQMGIGTGYLKPEYAAVGVPFAERGALTDEAIKVLRMAWTVEPVAHVSTCFEARDTCVPRSTWMVWPVI